MPQSIISQFSRAYNSPIEVNRQVATATERDAINSSVRWEGMLVYVIADGVTYELAGGISNGDWQELGGLQDAPSDGNTYGRKDGAWEIITSLVASGDFGNSGIILEGSTSGTYTMSSQSWQWSRSGNIVTFSITLLLIDGNTPTGNLQLNLSSTSFPSMDSSSYFIVSAQSFPVAFYSISAAVSTATTIRIKTQTSLDGTNSSDVVDADFTGSTILVISGNYITND